MVGRDLKKSVPARFRTANRRRESFEANWEHFFYAAFGIGFRVFPRFDNPRKMSDNRRQWADFLAALATLLHRQYKTARTETRWHLLLKIRQMPIQTSASRGYVLFISGNKRHTKVLKLSAGLRTHPAECSKLGKTQIIKDAGRGIVRNTGFCDQNTSRSCIRSLFRSFVLHTTVRDHVSPTTAVRRLPLLRAADTAAALPLLLRAP